MHSTNLPNPAMWILAAVLLTCCNLSKAQAGLIVSIPQVTVPAGQSGYLDVLISSEETYNVQSYLLGFMVGGPQHAASPINFVESSIPAPQLTSANYIFFGNSLEADFPLGLDFVSDSPGAPVANDVITVSDATLDLLDRTINDGDGPFLLARLNFVAPANATPGSVYNVWMDLGEFLSADLAVQPFSSNVGSITIDATAVPEPSSLALVTISSILWLGRSRLSRRRSRCGDDQGQLSES